MENARVPLIHWQLRNPPEWVRAIAKSAMSVLVAWILSSWVWWGLEAADNCSHDSEESDTNPQQHFRDKAVSYGP